MDNITLIIRDQEFTASKASLSEMSDYFRAMFSGNYVENDQKQIKIDVFEPNIMSIILDYIRIGLIDLSEHSVATIGELALAANFLQVTELMKQIMFTLDDQLSVSNWVETMNIAKAASYTRLESLSAAHGLFSFKHMKPEFIPTIQKLFWYLSHSYLDAETEFEVFKFGHDWIMQNQNGGDALLLILCCLDYTKLSVNDLRQMMGVRGNYVNSLAEKVIECLNEHAVEQTPLSLSYFTEHKSSICKNYTERVYREVVNLISATIKRSLIYTPVVPMWLMKYAKSELEPHFLYTYTNEKGFEKWLEVAERNLWGWSMALWGLTKIVIACGEYGRGTGIFMKSVKIYDTLKQEWIQHGVDLPCRRHANLTVVGDTLYIMGGVGAYRVLQDTVIVYNLKERSFRKIASLPDPIQNPAVCTHDNIVYTCGHRNIYRYEESTTSWKTVVNTDKRANCMISFKGHIYSSQNFFSHMYKFKPDEDSALEIVTQFRNPIDAFCNLRDRLIVFTRSLQSDIMTVEEFKEDNLDNKPKKLWLESNSEMKVNNVAGSGVVVMSIPPVDGGISETHKQYLRRFSEE